jgi:hypothetical protein
MVFRVVGRSLADRVDKCPPRRRPLLAGEELLKNLREQQVTHVSLHFLVPL